MIYKASPSDAQTIAAMAAAMWNSHTPDELTAEFTELLSNPEAAVFICTANGSAVGFAQCQLRHDYVEGTRTSPVGYLEGIFVHESFRRQGRAKALLTRCEQWARSMGCIEFASDCELTNADSLKFHLRMGFEEANRIICFTRRL